jgi:hypothetical protein
MSISQLNQEFLKNLHTVNGVLKNSSRVGLIKIRVFLLVLVLAKKE